MESVVANDKGNEENENEFPKDLAKLIDKFLLFPRRLPRLQKQCVPLSWRNLFAKAGPPEKSKRTCQLWSSLDFTQ